MSPCVFFYLVSGVNSLTIFLDFAYERLSKKGGKGGKKIIRDNRQVEFKSDA